MTAAAGGHERIYRSLLRAYPADYRHSFGDQMVQLFGDQLRDAGPTRTWLTAMGDIPRSAVSERLRRNRTVAHSITLAPTPASRILGLLGVVGGVLILLGFIGLEMWTSDLFNLRLVAFNLGAIAVATAAYQRHAAISRQIALAGTVPIVLCNLAYMLFIVKLVAQPGDLGPGDYQPINLFILATAAMWLSDAWFGLVTLRLRVLNRWSALALAVGSVLALLGMSNFGLQTPGSLAGAIILGGIAVHGLAWILLGLELALRGRRVPAAPA